MKEKVTKDRFVDVWLLASHNGNNVLWIAKELGITHQAVYARATKLRKDGVPLPQLPRSDTQDNRRLAERVVRESPS